MAIQRNLPSVDSGDLYAAIEEIMPSERSGASHIRTLQVDQAYALVVEKGSKSFWKVDKQTMNE